MLLQTHSKRLLRKKNFRHIRAETQFVFNQRIQNFLRNMKLEPITEQSEASCSEVETIRSDHSSQQYSTQA